MQRVLFVTGTDTGVGKTVVTALLAAHAPGAIALKPFCSGERTDAEILAELGGQTVEGINPWFYPEPVSPWTVARRAGTAARLDQVVEFIRRQSSGLILVEGAGGVLTPLGERLTAADLIRELKCEAILVAPNRLGVLNQACLAARALSGEPRIALIEQPTADASTATNFDDLRALLPACPIVRLPFLPALNAPPSVTAGFSLRPPPAFYRETARSLAAELDALLA